ncbi:hypothetical protein [Candidatus Azoamicus ciliaticola]|uniref:Uncharacterized protein n=1 Tax=Candidatus Azoamicus ciliaticola TaxID=2652803 RepID=A0A6J5JWT1_9GAMM|nr:hypothetical protein [Candidatus Azoamicus ciliaticola]CAB3976395.1 Uncharacterised protein [Candidatus Azoamicus ciliaticola]
MIVNDFELMFFLKKNFKFFFLLDDSLRSVIIFNIIKNFFKRKIFLVNFEDFNCSTYANKILVFKEKFHNIFDNEIIHKLISNNNVIILISNDFKDKTFINKINYFFKKYIIIITFKELTYRENFLWIKQFFIYKSYYFNDRICNYLSIFFKKKLELFIINFELNIYNKSLLQLLLNINLNINYDFSLINLHKKKINMLLYAYKNKNNHVNLLKKYDELNFKNKFIMYLFIILDINEKNNEQLNYEIILFNFIINTFFEKRNRGNYFDNLNIKYITKK